MANWKKVLVSGSNIDVNLISGSQLQLAGISGLPADMAATSTILTVDASGSVAAVAQSSLEGAQQLFGIKGSKTIGGNQGFAIIDTAGEIGDSDKLLFTTSSDQGFNFSVTPGTDTTHSISFIAPQALKVTSDVVFNTVTVADKLIHTDDSDTSIGFDGENSFRFEAGGNKMMIMSTINAGGSDEKLVYAFNNSGSNLNIGYSAEMLGGSVHPSKDATFVISQKQDINDPRTIGALSEFAFMVSGSKVGIGANIANGGDYIAGALTTNNERERERLKNVKLFISGGDLKITGSSITASLTENTAVHSLVTFNTSSEGFEYATADAIAGAISEEISGSFISASDSLYSQIQDITTFDGTSVEASASAGIRFQAEEGNTTEGSTISLTETASFTGTANQINITHSQDTVSESVLNIGLTNDVIIPNTLTVANEGDAGVALEVVGGLSASGAITASTLQVNGDATVTGTMNAGTFNIIGVGLVENQISITTGSTSFGTSSIDTHTFTGSLEVSGSANIVGPVSITDTLNVGQIDATGSANTSSFDYIATTGISSSGQIRADLTENGTILEKVVVYDTNTGELHITASSAFGGGGGSDTLGTPTDNSFDDGLLDFTAGATTITDAIDEINEVLAAIAPSPAPNVAGLSNLSTLSSITFGGNLSFGGSQNIDTYTNADQYTALDGESGLSNVGYNGLFDDLDELLSAGEGSMTTVADRQLGIINATSAPQLLGFKINEHVTADTGTGGTNFGANSFGDGDKGVLAIYVNDLSTPKHTLSLTGSDGPIGAVITDTNSNNTGILNLSGVNSASFTSTGATLGSFQHRSGSVFVGQNDQRNGWNYAVVKHQLLGSVRTTNYVTWINEIDNSPITAEFKDSTPNSIDQSGTKFLSGIGYRTSVTLNNNLEVINSYRNVYSDASDAITATNTVDTNNTYTLTVKATNGTGTSTGNGIAMPALATTAAASASKLHITSSAPLKSDVAVVVLSGSAAATTQLVVKHPTKSNLSENSHISLSAKDGILYDTRTDDSTATKETFVAETFRLRSGSYDTQQSVQDFASPIGNGPLFFASSASLLTNTGTNNETSELVVTPITTPGASATTTKNTGNGALVYPTRVANYSTIGVRSGTPPNYNGSGVSNTRFYFRAFQKAAGQGTANTINYTLKGSGNLATIGFAGVTDATSTSTKLGLGIKLPGATAFLDASQNIDNSNNLLTEGAGCFDAGANGGAIDITLNCTNVVNMNTAAGGGSIAAEDYVVFRIAYKSNFTGYVNEISINNFG